MENISLKDFTLKEKILLLKELGYAIDGKYVLDSKGMVVKDKYLGIPVHLQNLAIFPGSTIILDNNELSISMYLGEYADDFE